MGWMKRLCEEALEKHLRKNRAGFYGMYMGAVAGGFCQVRINSHPYCVSYIIDEGLERFFVDVYPSVICEKPYRQMLHAYVNAKSSNLRSGRIDVDNDTGEVRVRTETSIVSRPVSEKDIFDMELLAIKICEDIQPKIEKLAHGVWFEEDDSDSNDDRKKRLAKLLAEAEARASDDDDGDAEDIDDIVEFDDGDDDECATGKKDGPSVDVSSDFWRSLFGNNDDDDDDKNEKDGDAVSNGEGGVTEEGYESLDDKSFDDVFADAENVAD